MNGSWRAATRFALPFLCAGALALACRGDDSNADSVAAVPGAGQTSGTRDTDAAVAPAPATPADTNALTADGWRSLRIGMTRAQVVAAVGPDGNPNAVGSPDPAACDMFRPRSAPQGLLVMIERDTLTRISLSRDPGVSTDAGLEVGDSSAAVTRHYGARAEVMPHKYQDAPAKYLTVWTTRPPSPRARGIVYEIGAEDRITHIHAGGPSIQYVEGCL